MIAGGMKHAACPSQATRRRGSDPRAHHVERNGCVAFTLRVASPLTVMSNTAATTLFLMLFCLFSGCQTNDSAPDTQPADPLALTTETERGPVQVRVSVVPKEPRLSDEPELTLTVTAAAGVEVEMPPFGDALGDFIIRDFYEPLPTTADGNQVLKQVYTLEPVIAGKLSIDPITVRFTDNRPDGDGREHEVQSEAMLLTVATMIESEAPSLTDLRPPAAPVDIATPAPASTWLIIAAVIVTVVIFAALFFAAVKRKRERGESQLTPQQLAWRELNDLLGLRLSETDVKEFFVQLTGVVRRYIERSTGLNAPEQTTEEFLREMSAQQLFGAEVDRRLEAFLESADLVKFAGFQPDADVIKDATMRAKQFIELTPESSSAPESSSDAAVPEVVA